MKTIVIIIAAMLFSISASAQNAAIKINISSLGFGAEGVVKVSDNFNIRTGGNYFNFDFNGATEDYKYNSDVKLMTFPIVADWYPFGAGFKISSGAVFNLNKGDIIFTPLNDYVTEYKTFTPEEIGNLAGNMEYSKVSPYFGLGFGNPMTGSSKVGVSLDVGAMYQSSPSVKLNATEMLTEFPNEKAKVEGEIIEKMNYLKFYPVVTLGLSYRF